MTDFSDLFQILSMIFFLLTDGKSLVHVLQVNFLCYRKYIFIFMVFLINISDNFTH